MLRFLAEHYPDPERIGVVQASIRSISRPVIRPWRLQKHIERQHYRLDDSEYRGWKEVIV